MTPEEKQEIIDAVLQALFSDSNSKLLDITGLDPAQSLDGISTFPAVLTTTNNGVTTKALVSVPISLLTQAVQDVITNANTAATSARSAAAGWAAAAVKMGSDIVVIEGDISNLQDADKSLSSLTAYTECSTAANVSAKAVTVPYFALPTSGGCLHIKMEHANTAVSGVTLNINATGAKDLLYNGSAVSATNTWEDNEILEIYYDGTNYQATNAQGGGGSADRVSFDNSQSGLSAENVQDAIDEVAEEAFTKASVIDNSADSDLDITDELGNVLVRFKNGHIETKHFDSSLQTSSIVNDDLADFDIVDENGNVIVRFANGHIKTKNFDSSTFEESVIGSRYSLLNVAGIDIALSAQKRANKTYNAQNNYSKFPILLHLTDIHGDEDRVKIAKQIGDLLNVDCICNTGDTAAHSSSDNTSFMAEIMDKTKYVECLGNHDVWNLTSEQAAYTKYYQAFDGITNGVVLASTTNCNTLGGDFSGLGVAYPTYGYKDIASKSLRIIFFNQWQAGTMFNNRHYYFNYSQAQISFLVAALKNTPVGYGIVLMYHCPEVGSIVEDETYSKFFLSGATEPISSMNFNTFRPIKEIINAFINRTTLNKTYTNNYVHESNSNNDTFTVNANFTSVNSTTEFIMAINGHTHIDYVGYMSGVDANDNVKVLQCNEVCTNAWINRNSDGTSGTSYPYYNEGNDLSRQIGTPNENAFNVYVIDRENGVVKIIRVGSQVSTLDFSRRDCMIIPYK